MIRTFQLLFLVISAPLFLTAQEKKKTIQTIIIDPGHGGPDPGASGTFSTEAQVTLQVGLKLGKKLEEELPGLKVLFTRTTDVMAGNKPNKNEGLRYRADFANQSGADLFISIHCNSAGRRPGGWYERRVAGYETKDSYVIRKKKKVKVTKRVPVYENVFVPNKASGTETYIWAAHENDHKESMVNTEDISGEEDSTVTFDENDPVLQAYRLLYAKKFFKNSVMLAEMVEDEFVNAGRTSRGVKQRNNEGIWVLHATGMPSILIEVGFISNKEEEEFINSEAGQEQIVNNIISALKNYIATLEKQKTQVQQNNGETNEPKKGFTP